MDSEWFECEVEIGAGHGRRKLLLRRSAVVGVRAGAKAGETLVFLSGVVEGLEGEIDSFLVVAGNYEEVARTALGGHAMSCVDYSLTKERPEVK